MTPEDEAAVRARLEAATPGPWMFEPEGESSCSEPACCSDYWDNRIWGYGIVLAESHMLSADDAEFIAHARTDLPAALDEITRLRAALYESEAGRARLRRVVAEEHIVRVKQVTPCSCSAQRARAVAAESALEAVRALVGSVGPRSTTAGSPYSTGRWDAFAEVRAALDGETEDGVFGDPDIHARLTRAIPTTTGAEG